ncbi:MAG: hypothetical protein ABL994_19355, partial [Verrucomicrobiales bacterium]
GSESAEDPSEVDQDMVEVVTEIDTVSAVPLLIGQRPYLPVIKVEFLSTSGRTLVSEIFGWDDLLFASKALLNHVSDHFEGVSDLIASGMVVGLHEQFLSKFITDYRESLVKLEAQICTASDGGESK